MKSLIIAVALTASATQALAQQVVNLDQISCFVAILASRPTETLAPEVDAYVEGAVAGARALTKNDTAWIGRFTDICLADPNISLADAIMEAGAAAN